MRKALALAAVPVAAIAVAAGLFTAMPEVVKWANTEIKVLPDQPDREAAAKEIAKAEASAAATPEAKKAAAKAAAEAAKRAADTPEKREADRIAKIKALPQSKRPGASIGMTQEEVLTLTSWGRPTKVNRTTTAYKVSEQWVYNGGYLYFDDGVLRAIQN